MKLINRIKETWTEWNREPTIEEVLTAYEQQFLNADYQKATLSYEDGLLKAHIYTIDGQSRDVSWKYNDKFKMMDNLQYFLGLVCTECSNMVEGSTE